MADVPLNVRLRDFQYHTVDHKEIRERLVTASPGLYSSWEITPKDEYKVVKCSHSYMRQLKRLWSFEPWVFYVTLEERLPGEHGKIGKARLIDVSAELL